MKVIKDLSYIDLSKLSKELFIIKIYNDSNKIRREGFIDTKLDIGEKFIFKGSDIDDSYVCEVDEYIPKIERKYIKETNGDIHFYDTNNEFEIIVCYEIPHAIESYEIFLENLEILDNRLKKLNRIK